MLECHPDLQINLFFVTDPAPAELYTLSLTTLFRSPPPPPILRPLRAAVFFSRCRAFIFPWHVRASPTDRKSTRLNSSHVKISYAVFCLKKKKEIKKNLPAVILTSLSHVRYVS